MGAPRTINKEYIPLAQLIAEGIINVNSCNLEFKNNKLIIDNQEVNGFNFNLKDNYVVINGITYTSKDEAAAIRSIREFRPKYGGTYYYFLETGFDFSSVSQIKKITGAADAEVEFQVSFSVLSNRVWIKPERNHPLKFAIEGGISSDEIISISVSRLSMGN